MSLQRACCCSGCVALYACNIDSDVVQFSTTGNDPTYSVFLNPVTGVVLSAGTGSVTQTGGTITRSLTNDRTIVTWIADIEIDYTYTPQFYGGFETDCACLNGTTYSDLPAYSGTATFSPTFQYVCLDSTDGGSMSIPISVYYDFGADYVNCDRPATTKPPINGPDFNLQLANSSLAWTQSGSDCGDAASSYFDAELNFELTSTGDCGTTTTPGTEYSDPLTLTIRLGFS